ncbi:zincin-like metallopeptidase domain-containing protein [Petrimonas sp.]|uniref:zincin-like metallopeptidase domain-containing protein n=1 Tax=Petrimonas sp. TaxID=2023866 RepID=UPI003F51779A
MKTKFQLTAEKFAVIMLRKMEEMKAEKWETPWFVDNSKANFYPQNISGRKYESGNAFFLLLCSLWCNYRTPVFMTFNQCRKMNIAVTKGEESFPVYYRNFVVYHRETGDKLSIEDYNDLSEEKKKEYRLNAFINCYNVFNLDQTNFAEKEPEKFQAIAEKYMGKEKEMTVENVFSCSEMDTMIDNNSWVCDIFLLLQNKAYFDKKEDIIVCPPKDRFPNQHLFYSTLLHEMAHSTGTPDRLNREMGKVFGDAEYAREEVVAELTAAFAGFHLGVFAEPSKDSAAYLNGWIATLKKSPEYVFNVLDDVVKASNFITDKIVQEVELTDKVAI